MELVVLWRVIHCVNHTHSRTAVKEDEQSKSDPELRKSATLGSYSKPGYKPFTERSNSCNAAVANTLEKLADYSVKGVSVCCV